MRKRETRAVVAAEFHFKPAPIPLIPTGCTGGCDPRHGRGAHANEPMKVRAKLETQLRKDGLTYRETLPDGTMVYRRDAVGVGV